MYSIQSVEGEEAAEKLLNDSVNSQAELVSSHLQVVQQATGEQENSMLGVPVMRFTFIFKHVSLP
jgi:hypothetical protein